MSTVLDRRGGDRPRVAREMVCWTCGDVVSDTSGHTHDYIEHGRAYCTECRTCTCGEPMTVRELTADGCCRECLRNGEDLD
jgi:hypothetical protein